MILNKKDQERFIRFAIVGAIGAVIDLGVFNLLSVGFKIQPIFSQAISFSLAVVSNFIWNRLWTYPDSRNKPVSGQLIQFIVVSVIGLVVRTLIFDRLEEGLIALSAMIVPAGFFVSPRVIGHNLSLATVIIIIMFWNFFANRYWTYNDVS
jgi:putative flippase GtrA